MTDMNDTTDMNGWFEYYQSGDHQWRWRMRAGNGKIIATGGEGYSSKTQVILAIGRVTDYIDNMRDQDTYTINDVTSDNLK